MLDLTLLQLAQEAQLDTEYLALMKLIVEGRHPKTLEHNNPLHEYGPVFYNISDDDSPHGQIVWLDGHRIVIPKMMRHKMLNILHQ